jgi:hypothetical protein
LLVRAVVVLVSHGQAFAAIGPFASREEADAYADARNAHQSVKDLQGHVVPLTERDERPSTSLHVTVPAPKRRRRR